MADKDLKELLRILRADPSSSCAVTAAPDYESLVRGLLNLAHVHNLKVDRGDIDDAVDELNRIQVNPPSGTKFTPEQERVLVSSLAGLCGDFPPTTDWTNVASAGGNPCCLKAPS